MVHIGVPFNKSSYKQQCGRVGRKSQTSLSILVSDGNNKQSQYYLNHASELFSKSLRSILIDDISESLIIDHMNCMAAELAINLKELVHFFQQFDLNLVNLKEILETRFNYSKIGNGYYHKRLDTPPAGRFQIRSITNDNYQIVDSTSKEVVEIVEENRLSYTLYDGLYP